jgi:hypothetical protein
MKHYIKPTCKFGCRFLQITPSLWLCPHAAYGEASYLLGAVEQARALLERQGGYDGVLSRLIAEEDGKRKAKADEREARHKRPRAAEQVRYI